MTHAILASLGTGGDVEPFLRLGRVLAARGLSVTLASNAPYGELAAERGLSFRSLVTAEETERRLADPDLWHPVKGPLLAAEWGVGFLPAQYAELAELAREPGTVLVATPLVVAARLVQERLSRPLASILLQPWAIPSRLAPPVMPYGFTLPRRAPRALGRLYWSTFHGAAQLRLGRPINRMRRTLGLPPVRNVVRWAFSPDLVVGLFPDWFAPPAGDWPRELRLTGFPLERPCGELPPELDAFCRHEPPIAITFGTGMRHAERPFAATIEACQKLARPGIVLARHPPSMELPPSIHACRFAPFHALFPRCAAVVHHGGMGTLAEAIAAGIPQLILPFAHDQPDNAARIERLGLGRRLGPRSGAGKISRALEALLAPEVRERCASLAARLRRNEPLETAGDLIETLLACSAR